MLREYETARHDLTSEQYILQQVRQGQSIKTAIYKKKIKTSQMFQVSEAYQQGNRSAGWNTAQKSCGKRCTGKPGRSICVA